MWGNDNSNGHFVQGFVCNLGQCDIVIAEMKAMLYGIQMARDLNLKKIIVESDSSIVVSIISRGFTPKPHLKSLLEEILNLIRLVDSQVTVAYREANQSADFLIIQV